MLNLINYFIILTMEKQHILNIIREKRKIANLTQQEIAEKLAISRTQYANIENGNSEMSLDKFLKLIEILNLELSNFEQEKKKEVQKEILYQEFLHFAEKIKNL
jgi:transcriptional regulator with XRE-family HTH domain